MTDLFLTVKPKHRPGYGVSEARRTRFTDAFRAELAMYPDKPPSPKRLCRRMGWTPGSTGNLPGWASRLRRAMLKDAGFVQVERYGSAEGNRWVKPNV